MPLNTCVDCPTQFEVRPNHVRSRRRCPDCQQAYATIWRSERDKRRYEEWTKQRRPGNGANPYKEEGRFWKIIKDPSEIPYPRGASFSLDELRAMCKLGEQRIADGTILQSKKSGRKVKIVEQKVAFL